VRLGADIADAAIAGIDRVLGEIACGCWKTPSCETRKNKIACGSPTIDLLRLGRYFLFPQSWEFGRNREFFNTHSCLRQQSERMAFGWCGAAGSAKRGPARKATGI